MECSQFQGRSKFLRPQSGYRLYNESILDRLAFIKKAQLLGFSLDEIKELIDHKRAGENPCAEVREVVRIRLAELNERIQQMISYRDELTQALSEWDEIGEKKGHVCGLIEGSHISPKVNSKENLVPKK